MKAGMHCLFISGCRQKWIPAFAGMTEKKDDRVIRTVLPIQTSPFLF
ncbi:Uncharacterized protein dnm_099580 [Desulfonema magnum]|uniref:Uncharacterized protein n=1 Tax=Desulfonema magnum TaxID=45655 RepID=A0A975C0E4_9BACT|nr:Uncharacterized protein dnm_099580 [Desulfonema magnum]